ncbi:MAG: RES family NAD+ phosphorylase [Desulfatitalea sp.]|nr:RES family NAD+ phosphorylase [Desulfatitalea sp.]NNJ99016.1 RES family NAD+ phosphorylase [Desulfatitalea sp.]
MKATSLFQRLSTLDSEPAFRNANKRLGKSAFDDLVDPDEKGQASAQMASREANRMRSEECLSVVDSTHLYSAAILNVFQRVTNISTRYGDGSFPVWYGCLNSQTTIWETAYHMIREEIGRRGRQGIIERHRTIYEVSCTAILVDLTGEAEHLPKLTTSTNYSFTQQIGRRVKTEGHPGLLAPSARQRDGKNLVVFHPKILSNPKVGRNLIYQFDPEAMRVHVVDAANNKSVMSVDGKIWF